MQRPLYYRARLSFANSAFNLRLYDEAIPYYLDAVAMVPNSNTILSALAEAYLEDGQPEKAMDLLRQSLEMGETIEARLLLGIGLMHLGDSLSAIESLTDGLISGEEPRLDALASERLAEAYVDQGEAIWNFTAPAAAIDLWQRVLKLNITLETKTEARKLLAEAYLQGNNPIEAARSYRFAAAHYWEREMGARRKFT